MPTYSHIDLCVSYYCMVFSYFVYWGCVYWSDFNSYLFGLATFKWDTSNVKTDKLFIPTTLDLLFSLNYLC